MLLLVLLLVLPAPMTPTAPPALAVLLTDCSPAGTGRRPTARHRLADALPDLDGDGLASVARVLIVGDLGAAKADKRNLWFFGMK